MVCCFGSLLFCDSDDTAPVLLVTCRQCLSDDDDYYSIYQAAAAALLDVFVS